MKTNRTLLAVMMVVFLWFGMAIGQDVVVSGSELQALSESTEELSVTAGEIKVTPLSMAAVDSSGYMWAWWPVNHGFAVYSLLTIEGAGSLTIKTRIYKGVTLLKTVKAGPYSVSPGDYYFFQGWSIGTGGVYRIVFEFVAGGVVKPLSTRVMIH